MKKKSVPPAQRKKARFGSRRAEVVALLQRGIGTVSDLATRLHLTKNAVRSHLLALEREGLVSRKGSQAGTRRPHELYQFTARAQKFLTQASDASLSALLTAMKRRLPASQLRELLEGGGKALAERFETDGSEKPLRARVQNAVRLLNQMGGGARIDTMEQGFVIRSRGCPLAPVVAEHPETCQMMESFLALIVRAPVRESCIRNGKSHCQFAVSSQDIELSRNN